MKRKTIILLAAAAAVLLLVIVFVGSYNGLVSAQTDAESKAATVDTMLTRRADLIPNLVNTVKGYAAHETELFTEIANARARLSGSLTVADKNAANAALDSALSRLLVVVERYPDLKASQQFLALQDQLEGAENRISTARVDYNEAVRQYNRKLRRFPSNLIGKLFGFSAADMYSAPAEDTETPNVNFD